MPDRRLVLATLAATLLVAGAVIVPAGIEAQPDESLEPSSVGGPIANAIDAGASDSLAGLLPTSEAHQRVTAIVNGLKDGIPASPPSLDTAQLADVTAIASGAADGALASSPNTLTSSFDKAALRALAKGYMSGALSQMASAPSQGRAAVDGAAAAGVFTAATSLFVGEEPMLSPGDYEAYGRRLASESFDELELHGAAFSAIAGSPALADITFFTTTLVRGQLESLPTGVAREQLDAVATFGAGALDGMIVGMVQEFPRGAPLPAREDLERWFDALAHGHEGTPPWTKPSSLPLLFAWADGVGAAAVEGVAQTRERIGTVPTPPSSLDELSAWADGVASGGYERIDAIPATGAAVEADVRAYAAAVTAPAIGQILAIAGTDADPELVGAWALGITAGVEGARGASLAALGLTEEYLAGLSTAITALPTDAIAPQAAMVKEFGEGVTNQLTLRMDNVTRAVVAEEDSDMIVAMATGIAEAAVALAGAEPLSQPQLAEALGDGIASGFLETRNPQALFDDADQLEAVVRAWIATGPPASIAPLGDLAYGGATGAYHAARSFGKAIGGAPVDWASARGSALTTEGFGGVEDALWMVTFAETFAAGLLGSIDPGNLDPTVEPVMAYAASALAAIGQPNATQAISNITAEEGDFQQHAFALATYLTLPATWINLDPDAATLEAARAVANATLDEADDVERFTDATYTSATLAYIDAIALGLVPDDPGDPSNGEYLSAWITGLLAAHEEMPKEEIEGDLTARLDWVASTVTIVAPLGEDITATQYEAARRYAEAAAGWALSTPDRVPDMEGMPTPLLVWADATIATALERLPPAMTPEEKEAVDAYLEGIAQAVTALPDPTQYDWTTLPDQAAIHAYLAGITSGIDRLPEETSAFLCASIGKDCPEPPPCEQDCPPPPPPEPPEPCDDDMCRLEDYTAQLTLWASTLAGAIETMPDTTPTQEGIALVEQWAYLVLGAHGACRPGDDDPTCWSPRGPVMDFVTAQEQHVRDANEAIGLGLAALLTYEPDPENPLPVDPAQNPVLGWAAGLTSAIGGLYREPTSLVPTSGGSGGSGDPLVEDPPLGDPTDYEYRQLLFAWADSLWQVPGKLRDDTFAQEFPDISGINATIADLDAFFAERIYEGGAYAILDTADEVEQYAREVVPDQALDAWALGLGQAVQDTLVDPTQRDLEAMLAWYEGAAQGGVDAIIAAGDAATQRQVPMLRAYAEILAQTYAPPAPPELDGFGILRPDEEPEDGSSGGGSGEEPAEEDDEQRIEWLEILQAYAAGMGDAVLTTPFQPTVDNVDAFHADVLFYLDSLAAAASAAPPVAPDAGFPARLRAWVEAESAAAIANPPTTAERATLDPDVALALAYVDGFARTSAWNLEEKIAGKEAWARSAIEAGLSTPCPHDAAAEACAQLGETLGEALGQSLPQEAGEIPLPTDDERLAFVRAIIEGAAPALPAAPEAAGAEMVIGLVAGLAPEGVGHPDADEASRAAASAVGGAIDAIPFVAIRPTSEEIVAFLLRADPARYQALAEGAVALVVGMGDAAEDPTLVQQRLEAYLASTGEGDAMVSVTDGGRTRSGDAIDGTVVLDGLRAITVSVYPSASSPVEASWELRWSADDPNGASASRVAMRTAEGAFTATLQPTDLAGLARGASVRFVVVQTAPGSTSVHDRDGQPYAFVPDRDAPQAQLSAGEVSGASLPLSWSGSDGDSAVASYRIETRDGEGAWTEWIAATAQTSASFTGDAGHAYRFRVTATDAVGHAGAPVETGPVTIPAGAAPNRAPVVAFAAPGADAVFGKSIAVSLTTSDPDGTEPVVRVCLRKESADVDLSCPYEGRPGGIAIETRGFADGRYRLHAIASDGTQSSEAMSPVFAVDRTPPSIRGAAAQASPLSVVLSASVDGAAKVFADVAGRTLQLADDGKGADARAGDGTWSASASVPAGEHLVVFRALDASGNEARTSKTIVVPAPPPPPGSATPGGAPTTQEPAPPVAPPATPAETPAKAKGVPAPALLPLLVALAAVALALRRKA